MGLITRTARSVLKAHVPAGGPKENFAAYMEWVLVHNESPFTVCPADNNFTTSPTPLPETNQSPPVIDATGVLHMPTAD